MESLDDVSRRYNALCTALDDILARNGSVVATRKQFESDILRLELWRRETETTCSCELQLDCPLDFLDEQFKKHQVRLYGSLSPVSCVTSHRAQSLP